METNRLVQFKVLVETANMRKAADLLHISHGGLSKSIKTLESELEVKLIVPDGRGFRVTEEGRRIYENSLNIIKNIESFIQDVKKETASKKTKINIGTFEVFSTYFLGALIKKYLIDYSLLLREFGPGQLEKAVSENIIDIGITYLPMPHPNVEFLKATSVEMGIFTAKNAFKNIPLERLPFAIPVMPIEGAPSRVKGLDGWPDHLFKRNIQYQVELMESGLELCRQGLAALFIPKFIVRLHNQNYRKIANLKIRAYPKYLKNIHHNVYLIIRRGYTENRIVNKLSKAIQIECTGG